MQGLWLLHEEMGKGYEIMFDTFGNFDSAKELNDCAAGLLAEGDIDNLMLLAKENGIPNELAELYSLGELPELADAVMAAVGKLDIEVSELQKKYKNGTMKQVGNIPFVPIADYVKAECMDPEVASRVRRKEKNLEKAIQKLISKLMSLNKGKMSCMGYSDQDTFNCIMEYYNE